MPGSDDDQLALFDIPVEDPDEVRVKYYFEWPKSGFGPVDIWKYGVLQVRTGSGRLVDAPIDQQRPQPRGLVERVARHAQL